MAGEGWCGGVRQKVHSLQKKTLTTEGAELAEITPSPRTTYKVCILLDENSEAVRLCNVNRMKVYSG